MGLEKVIVYKVHLLYRVYEYILNKMLTEVYSMQQKKIIKTEIMTPIIKP